ncbi:apolipo protein O-domain-containing protein [Exophiala viscosa]|uniref:MICOS complex subunit n=1 Tax=Exophiala viscosa TaxID=2486360 RepID=A0AAN6DSZ1_9EURO|nr:apolipo protein O-domain-containing protein [Exophiala viscosa]
MARIQMLRASRRAALVVLGGAAATQGPLQVRTAFAEAPSKEQLPEKKPIYSSYPATPTAPTIPSTPATDSKPHPTSPTPTDRLTEQVKNARVFLYHHSLLAENSVNDSLTWAFKKETNFANTIASLAPKAETGEQLLPGAIYVLVATLAGSIVSRNRNILIRASFPLAVGITAGWFLIPVTMENTSNLIWEYEKRVPAVAETHLQISSIAKDTYRQARGIAKEATHWADETANETRKRIEDVVSKGK